MLTSIDWISYLKSYTSIKSDYGVAKLLEINRSTISSLTSQRTYLGIKTSQLIAAHIDIDQEYIYICAQFERAKTEEERMLWMKLYEKIGGMQVDEKIRKIMYSQEMQAG